METWKLISVFPETSWLVDSGTTKIVIKWYDVYTKLPFQVSGNRETSRNQWKHGNDFDILLVHVGPLKVLQNSR
jgi:hypothetical protein